MLQMTQCVLRAAVSLVCLFEVVPFNVAEG